MLAVDAIVHVAYFHARYLQSQWRKCDLPVKSQAVGSTVGKVSGSRKAPKSHFTVQAGFGRGFRQAWATFVLQL